MRAPLPPTDPSKTIRDLFSGGRFAVVLAGFVVAAHPEVVFGLGTFFFRDFGFFGYPLAFHHRESFWRGEVPLWNPLSNCGIPFLAQWNTLVLYPGSLFYLLFPLSWSLGVYCLAHQYLAGLGMYWLARQWTGNGLAGSVAGVAFAFNGLTLNCLMWPNNIAAMGWMPWVVLAVEKAWRQGGGRRLRAAVLIGSMQMLTGAPEIIALTWVLLGALGIGIWVAKRGSRLRVFSRLLIAPVLISALAAVQLFPFLDLVTQSQRDESFADSYGSMPGWGWANLLVPMFNCFTKFFGVYAQFGQYWTSSYYCGAGILFLAVLTAGRIRNQRVWILAAGTMLSLVLALGDGGRVYSWLKEAVPQLGFMRYPIKFVVLAAFCIPLLGAYAIQKFTDPTARRLPQPTVFLGAAFLALIGGIAWFVWRYPLFEESPAVTWPNALSRAGLLLLALTVLCALVHSASVRGQLLLGIGLVGLTGLDGLTHMPRLNPVIARSAFEPGQVRLNPHPRHGDSRAMISPAAEARFHQFGSTDAFNDYLVSRLGLYVNCNLLDTIPKVDGLYSLYLRGPIRVEEGLLKASADPNSKLPRLLDFLGVAQVTAAGEYYRWTNRATALPLATTGQKAVFADDTTTFLALASPDFAPADVVYLPPEAKPFIRITNQTESAILSKKFAAHRLELEIEADQPSLLVIAQAHYRCWRAFVDERPQRIWRANVGYQALSIPAGQHVVKLIYRDRAFGWGMAISLLLFSGCLAVHRVLKLPKRM